MKSFRLGLLLSALLALYIPAHAEVVGRVLMAAGDAAVIRDNQELRVGVGFPIEDRDTLKTGPFSNMQVRFTDQSIVSLRDHSLLKIDEYKFDGKQDGLERAFFNLIKGGFRTITGLIGKVNKSNYAVKTATATIGIRGTNFALLHCAEGSCGARAKDGVYGGVSGGIIAATNSTGEYQFGSGDYFYVPSKNEPPKKLIGPPSFFADRLAGEGRVGAVQTASGGNEQQRKGGAGSDGRPNKVVQPYQQQIFISTQYLGPNTGPSVIPPSLNAVSTATPAPAPAPSFVFPATGAGGVMYYQLGSPDATGFPVSGSFTANANGQLTMINDPINNPTLVPNAFIGTASVLDSGSDASAGNLTWGRWDCGTGCTTPPTVNGSQIGSGPPILHYAIGDPVTNLPTANPAGCSGYCVAFSPVGATTPTNANGLTGNFQGGSVMVDFVAASMLTSLQIGFNSATYNMTGTTNFSSNGQFQGIIGGTCSGSTCAQGSGTIPGGCSGGAQCAVGINAGSLTGKTATGIAMVYSFSDTLAGGTNGSISGAVGFKR